jgi:hypothetical protein
MWFYTWQDCDMIYATHSRGLRQPFVDCDTFQVRAARSSVRWPQPPGFSPTVRSGRLSMRTNSTRSGCSMEPRLN